ncbi:SprT-like domain-containing protein [Gluconobacter cerinus]|uniref:SprT-like domain-containing protein n=1 Tax=Gluconobacter cerinus TaxID=38307 RepID=UPI001B8CAE65|nr:SprT-like domain-containing protein [Gluconobacter cerinus]MBS0984641.1 SprT-like domain-containing protein [Gluconobacter cerinus]
MNHPTDTTYRELQTAYDHFNKDLFDGHLPACLITLQREKKTFGYFSSERFEHRDKTITDEIALNPAFFGVRSIEESLSTLVHEMVHLWQAHFGKPGRGRYHNKEWAAKMVDLGLPPTSTGEPGGKMTGDQMTHMINPDGRFAASCERLIGKDYTLSWVDRFPPRAPNSGGDAEGEADGEGDAEPKNKSNRVKFRCPICEAQAWGKPNLRLLCGGENCEAAALVPAD